MFLTKNTKHEITTKVKSRKLMPKKSLINFISHFIPYGVIGTGDDLNPRLYTAVHIYWLKFYGMWYNDFSPKNILFWIQIIYTIVVLCLVCFLPCIGEVVYLLRRADSIGNVAEGLYLFLSEAYTYFKISVFWLNKNKILSLLKYLYCKEFRPIENEHKEIVRKSIKTARFVMTYYSTMCVVAVSVAMVMPIAENFEVLPTNVEYPYLDVYKTPLYQIFYLHHIYYKPATCIIDGVMDTILAAFVASAIGQIEILSFNLRNFDLITERRVHKSKGRVKGTLTKDRHKRIVLRECIIHHNSIIRYVSMIEDAFSLASALQFMLSAMVLCLIGVQFLSIENPASHPFQIAWTAIYLSCMLIEVFILCWFGDRLIWQSKDLQLAAYESPWLNTDNENKRFIVLFMQRCQKPLMVTAGKMFTLSLSTYTILMNWSYKAFAVMSNTKKK